MCDHIAPFLSHLFKIRAETKKYFIVFHKTPFLSFSRYGKNAETTFKKFCATEQIQKNRREKINSRFSRTTLIEGCAKRVRPQKIGSGFWSKTSRSILEGKDTRYGVSDAIFGFSDFFGCMVNFSGGEGEGVWKYSDFRGEICPKIDLKIALAFTHPYRFLIQKLVYRHPCFRYKNYLKCLKVCTVSYGVCLRSL